MTIWAFCKDPGGAQTFGPVVKLLRESGYTVRFFVKGFSAKHVLNRMRISHIHYASAQSIVSSRKSPDLILTYISENIITAKTVCRLLKRTCNVPPTLALTDYWGATTADSDENFQPDYITVNDNVGAKVIKKTWPSLPTDHIVKTGFFTLDKYAKYYSNKIRVKIRQKLRVNSTLPVVLFTGQLERSGEILEELAASLNEL